MGAVDAAPTAKEFDCLDWVALGCVGKGGVHTARCIDCEICGVDGVGRGVAAVVARVYWGDSDRETRAGGGGGGDGGGQKLLNVGARGKLWG